MSKFFNFLNQFRAVTVCSLYYINWLIINVKHFDFMYILPALKKRLLNIIIHFPCFNKIFSGLNTVFTPLYIQQPGIALLIKAKVNKSDEIDSIGLATQDGAITLREQS